MCLNLICNLDVEMHLIFLTASMGNLRLNEAIKVQNELLSKGLDIKVYAGLTDIQDGLIHEQFEKSTFKLYLDFVKTHDYSEIVTTAYEGGHQDHDSAFILSFQIAKLLDIPLKIFSTYYKDGFLPYRVMKRLQSPISQRFNRFEIVSLFGSLVLIYKTQWKTWLGLSPFVLFKYLSGKSTWLSDVEDVFEIETTQFLYSSRKRAVPDKVIEYHKKWLREFN